MFFAILLINPFPFRQKNLSNPSRAARSAPRADLFKFAFSHLAETGGFEPPVQFYPDNTLAPCRFKPLSHVSLFS